MTDGLGSTSYSYDQMSRLTSETRVFSVGSYTLSYTYNLANELTSITDPFAGMINYAFDSAGRVNSVTGSGYGSVSQFAYDMRYRAWGRLKSLSYSTSRGMSLGYNSRMQVSLFQVNGQNQTVGTEYQYYQDGRIRYSRDLTDGRFDRSYTYDQVARLTTNFTGAEARGVNTPDGPYKQTYGHDGWGNLNQRTGRHWGQNLEPVSFTFDAVTNRNPQWQYDAEGNVTAQESRQYIFDAAGRQLRATDGTNYLAHEFDGDGLKAKRANPGWVGYYVRSTALAGAIVAELNPQGQPWKRYIYSNGQLLAEELDTGQINWKHRSPSNTTEFVSLGTGGGRAEEYDPAGTDVGTADPYVDPEPGGGFEDWTSGKGVPTDLTTGCSWEGMSIGCDYAFKILFMRGYTGSRRVGIRISHRSIPGVGASWLQASHVNSRVIGEGVENSGVWSEGEILEYKNYISSPDGHQSSIVRTERTGPVPLPDLGKGIQTQLKNKECADFIGKLLKQNAAANPQDPVRGTSLMDLFTTIGQHNYVLQRDLNIRGTAVNGLATGTIGRGNARALLRTRDYYTTDTRRQTATAIASSQLEYVMAAIHETFHLAGTYGGGWTDERLARTALAITGDNEHFPNPSTATVLDWSSYLNRQLYSKCAPGFRGY